MPLQAGSQQPASQDPPRFNTLPIGYCTAGFIVETVIGKASLSVAARHALVPARARREVGPSAPVCGRADACDLGAFYFREERMDRDLGCRSRAGFDDSR